MLIEVIPAVQSLAFTDVIVMTCMVGQTYTYLHGDITTICPVRGEHPAPLVGRTSVPSLFFGRPHHRLTLTSSQPRPPCTTSISNPSLRKYIQYNRIAMTDVVMLPVLILTRYSLRKESGDAALEWASGGECHALSFFDFRHCLTIFSLDSFANLIRN